MTLQWVQLEVIDFWHQVPEDLLVGKEPGCIERIEDGSVGQGPQCMLRQSMVIHGWLSIRVCHPQPLCDVRHEQTRQSYWEQKWLSSTKEECHIDNVHYEGQSVVDKKLRPAVYSLELSDCLGVRSTLVAGADGTLIDHAFENPDGPEEEVLDQGEDDIESGGLGDKAADIQEPLCREVSVDS